MKKDIRYAITFVAICYVGYFLVLMIKLQTGPLTTKRETNGIVVKVENCAIDHNCSKGTSFKPVQTKNYVTMLQDFKKLQSETKTKTKPPNEALYRHNRTSPQFEAGYWHYITKAGCKSIRMSKHGSTSVVNLAALVDDKHKLIVCPNVKAGSTYLAKVFAILLGQDPARDPSDVNTDTVYNEYLGKQPHLNVFSYEEKLEKIQNYFKAILVKEPFSRLLSAYRDKIEKPTSEFYARKALNMRRKKPGTTTFPEFVAFLTRRTHIVDPHWRPYYQACSPCEMDYDFVAKVETINADMTHIFEKVGLKVTDIAAPTTAVTEETDAILEQYYKQVPQEYLHKLYELYKPDFVIFNYSIPGVIKAMM